MTLDVLEPALSERLKALEAACGWRNVQRIVVEGGLRLEPDWMAGSLFLEQFNKLTRSLRMNTVLATFIPQFNLSDARDSFEINECVVNLLIPEVWLPYVREHLQSQRLTISRWVLDADSWYFTPEVFDIFKNSDHHHPRHFCQSDILGDSHQQQSRHE